MVCLADPTRAQFVSAFVRANYYANTVNVWPDVVWAANLICAPQRSNLTFPGAEMFLGENDDWRACVMRLQQRQAG